MEYGVFSANEFLYTDSYLGMAAKEVKIDAARDSYAAFQVACKPRSSLAILFEPGSDLPCPEIFMVLPVDVMRNTDVGYNGQNYLVKDGDFVPYATRKAPFTVFDALLPIDYATDLGNQDLKVFYFRFCTNGLASGNYKCKLNLMDGEEETIIPVEINLHKVAVPKKETLRITNWFHPEKIAEYLDAPMWSEAFWEYLYEYGVMMRSARQTDFFINHTFFKEHSFVDGKYVFDFTNAKKLIEMYFALGFTYIEGPIMLYRKNWHYSEFYIKIGDEDVDALSEKGIAFVKDFYSAWYAFLKENDWDKCVYQHVGDEPGEHCLKEYSRLSQIIRECMPNVPIIEALANASFSDAVDIMVPKSVDYLREKDAFDKIKEQRPMWYYTCCEPGGEYLNRLLDQELLRSRLLHWANYIYGFSGFLHWGLNYYINNQIFDVCGGEYSGDGPLPSGDTHVIYFKDGILLNSLRLEMMRYGAEDYELINMLEKFDNDKLAPIVSRVIRSFGDYTKSMHCFNDAYKELLNCLDMVL